MKKDTLFWHACLSLLTLGGMLFSGARAQETEMSESYSVSLYGLTAEAVAPAHPTDGWTEYQMPALGASGRDTLTKMYLRTDAAPLNLTTQQDVTLNAIGFGFPYGGRTMTHFGVTGNGLIYLGAAVESAEPSETSGQAKRSLKYVSSPMSLEDAIAAFPQCGTRPYTVHNVADAETKIGYYEGGETDDRYLVISFRNVLASFAGSDKKDYEIRLTYDVILREDGRIMFRFDNLSLSADEQKQLLFAYGLFGKKAEQAICAKDWNGGFNRQSNGNPFTRMAMTDKAATAVLTFTLPQPCAAPQGVTATATVKDLYSTDFSGVTLQIGTDCDGWLVLVSDNGAMTERPEDGRVYKSIGFTPDSIGGFPVKLVSSTSKSLNNVNGLKSNTSYYIYVYPYNEICIGGPVYQQEPAKIEVKTAIAGPVVETAEVKENAVTFTFPELAADAEILVGMSRRDCRKDTKRYVLEGISGKETAYNKGDTIFQDLSETPDNSGNKGPYVLTVAHAGKVTDRSLTISGLEPATPYYFYFWTALEGDNQYSKEYIEASVLTVPTTPYTFTFATDRVPVAGETILPAGWHCSAEGMNATFAVAQFSLSGRENQGGPDERRVMKVSLSAKGAERACADAITPWFATTHPEIDIRYRVSAQLQEKLAQLRDDDTLSLWYREEGQSAWKLVQTVTNDKEWGYEADYFTTLSARISNVADKKIQLRFMIGGKSSLTQPLLFFLREVLVEPHLSCAYAGNMAVVDSLTTHRTLTVGYENANRTTLSALYRYREQGSEEWIAVSAAQERNRCTLNGLEPHTVYEVAVRLVCAEGDSSLVKTVTGQTFYGVPYEQNFAEESAFPDGFKSTVAVLPAGEDEPAVLDFGISSGYKFALKEHAGQDHNTAGIAFNFISGESEPWLVFPTIALEKTPAPAVFTFKYKAYTWDNPTQSASPVDPESQFRLLVLVSTDGRFRRADSVGELYLRDMRSTDFQTDTIDLSAYTDRVYVALYAESPGGKRNSYTFFLVDSVEAHYTGDRPCYPVEDLRQYGLTDTGITLSWTGYSEEYGIYYTDRSSGATDSVYTTETTYTLGGLQANTTYTYRIQAFCETGRRSPGALSAEKFFTTNEPADPTDPDDPEKPVCGAPTALVCDSVSETYAALSWAAGENNVSYILAYSPVASASDFTEVAVSETTYRIAGLQSNTAYAWRMKGVCAADTSALVEGPDFTTKEKETGVEKSFRWDGLKVGSNHGRIAVYNTGALPIDRVEVYGLNGRRLYEANFGGVKDNLLLPALDEGAHLVLVRIFSAGDMAVYKIVLM